MGLLFEILRKGYSPSRPIGQALSIVEPLFGDAQSAQLVSTYDHCGGLQQALLGLLYLSWEQPI